MKSFYDVVVVVPIGPDTSSKFIVDTIESYIFYTAKSFKIILLDDSHQDIGKNLKIYFPNADLFTTTEALGGWAGLYITLSNVFSYAIDNYHFTTLLKLDTDALIIGPEPEKEALALFKSDPLAGIAGQYPNDYFGEPWNLLWPRRRILNGTRTWKFIRRPIANIYLIKLYNKALKSGYRTGESVFGGAYFVSETLLYKLKENGFLPYKPLKWLNLGEDHLFSLLTKVVGFNLVSLSAKEQGFGCAWKGLPVSPEQLLADKKTITHSVRYWEDKKEEEIRSFFKEARNKATVYSIKSW